MTQEDINGKCAEAAHEINRIFCEATGDNSQLSWKEAPDWQQKSAIEGVKFALEGHTPAEQHASWCDNKYKDGWKFGPVKDPDKKEHHCLVPYDQLPLQQQLKDGLFIKTVTEMAKALHSTLETL
jgi:hypothetical protein